MKVWTDAQFPPLLAGWIAATFRIEASNLDGLGLRHATDLAIFEALRSPGNAILTKDEDFVDLVTRLDAPPHILWVTCGNLTNRAMGVVLRRTLMEAISLLERGERVVEIR